MMLTMLVTRVVKYDVNYVIDVNYGTLNDGMRICIILGYRGCRRRRVTLDDHIRLSWMPSTPRHPR